MKRISVLAAGACTAVMGLGAYAAVPAKAPPPIADYWMDVSTVSGFGAAMMGGGRPDMSQVMNMMNGGGAVSHSLLLRLSSREKATGEPQGQHWIPAGLQMGASLPLVSPKIERPEPVEHSTPPSSYEKPKGRMLVYWGCGEHAPAPMVIDFAQMASGKMPANLQALAKMGAAMGRMAGAQPRGAENSAAFGEWPNPRDSRPVPATGSLIGAHKVEANYAPTMSFALAQGQDFMPGLGLREAGALPSGADRLLWQPAAQATGYALAMFGSNQSGDMIIWSSAKSASLAPAFDYLPPNEVKQLIASGAVLPPETSQCILPAEVAAAVPQGMVMEIGYGPQAFFSDAPKAPKWTARVRYKTTAMLMRGMGSMMEGMADQQQPAQQPQQQQPAKKRKFGIGDLLGGSIPIPH